MKLLANGRMFDDTKYDERFKYNIYQCDRGHNILSADVDRGVTPMFITCRRRPHFSAPRCGARAQSLLYPAPPPPAHLFPVLLVWRLPTRPELRRARRDNFIDHYQKGGLAMEWINE